MMKTKVIQLAIVPVFALTGCGDDAPKQQKVTPTPAPAAQVIRQQDGSYKQCANGKMVPQHQTCYKKCSNGRVMRDEQDCNAPVASSSSGGSSSGGSSYYSGSSSDTQRNGFGSTSGEYGMSKSAGG